MYFTGKSILELSGLGLYQEDAVDALCALSGADSQGRLRSAATGQWMYVFKPTVGDILLYVKVVLRDDCIVVSFHADEEGHGPHP
ncbi:MAG: hypothetical protein WKG00_18330 [Polyangiaceae bacterium]